MKRGKAFFFLLGWIGMLVYFSQRWIIGPLIPSLMHDFAADRTQLGVVGAANMWGYMLTPIVAGLLSDRFGRKYAVLAGIAGLSALTAVSGLTQSAGQLFAARFVTGMWEAFYFIPLIAFMLELFPERPGFYLTLMTSGSSLGWFARSRPCRLAPRYYRDVAHCFPGDRSHGSPGRRRAVPRVARAAAKARPSRCVF